MMSSRHVVACAGLTLAAALLGHTAVSARPYQSYYPQNAYQPAPREQMMPPQTRSRQTSGVRLNIPWQQWSQDVAPPQPAPQQIYRGRQYASTGREISEYYYPQETYQSYQPAQPSWQPPEPYGAQGMQQSSRGGMDPRFAKQIVAYQGREKPGTLIIDTDQKFLFLVQPGGQAIRYGVGVGKPGFEWAGIKSITRKAEWPDWTPPDEMLKRRPDLPRFMPGGPGNPLGARAMYLGSSLYRIHGTNEPETIGRAVSSGCIRMVNDDVIDLYSRVRVGARVVVI